MKNLFNITINKSNDLPNNFSINYNELENWDFKKYKPNKTPESKLFPFNKSCDEWNIEIIYFNAYCIAGRIFMPTEKNVEIHSEATGVTMIIPIDFMFSKTIIEKSKNRKRWRSPFFNQMNEVHVKKLNNKMDELFDESIKKIKGYKIRRRKKNEN